MRTNFGVKPYLFPQPVLIIATYDEQGHPNAMNAAWGGMADDNQVMICLSSHKTTQNLAVTQACTINIGDVDNLIACDYVGITSANTTPDKFAKTGWTTTRSQFVNAPIINELPVALECTLLKIVGDCQYIFQIQNVSIADRVLTNGKVDYQKFQPLTYDPANHGYYSLGTRVGQAFADGQKIK